MSPKKFQVGYNMSLERSSLKEDGTNSENEPQDADYSCTGSLSNDSLLLILARVPRAKYSDLCSVNKHFLSLLRGGDLYKIRREVSVSEPLVYLLLNDEESRWWAVDPILGSRRRLPLLPASVSFTYGDKETLCVKTQLLVSGNEIEGLAIWRYELITDQWYKGPSMITPRCLFASANCGNFAWAAGGIGGICPNLEILDSAEKYNPEKKSWEEIPRMNMRRKLCAGCYMDGKFYAIGGQNEEEEDGEIRIRDLTCGEFYDSERNTWELIPGMISGASTPISRSPPLLAVVNNELYALEASSNQLRVYLKRSNSWKDLGEVPVRADQHRGWGVAFKSLGEKLLLIGGSMDAAGNPCGRGMTIYTCCPDPDADSSSWVGIPVNCVDPFVFNCSVMIA